MAEYRICSPAEIGNAVRRCAESAFYQGRPGEIEFEDLLKQRQEFTPAMEREFIYTLILNKYETIEALRQP